MPPAWPLVPAGCLGVPLSLTLPGQPSVGVRAACPLEAEAEAPPPLPHCEARLERLRSR